MQFYMWYPQSHNKSLRSSRLEHWSCKPAVESSNLSEGLTFKLIKQDYVTSKLFVKTVDLEAEQIFTKAVSKTLRANSYALLTPLAVPSVLLPKRSTNPSLAPPPSLIPESASPIQSWHCFRTPHSPSLPISRSISFTTPQCLIRRSKT